MGIRPARHEATRPENFRVLLAAAAAWAAVIALSPWPALGLRELTGVGGVVWMVACTCLSSMALGGLLGRARACWLLAACSAVGETLWMVDLAAIDGHVTPMSPTVAAAATALASVLVVGPLLGGAMVGRCASFLAQNTEPAAAAPR